MHFSIQHTTTYRYSRPVQLLPHVLRLTPRAGGGVHPVRHAVQVHPRPAGTSESIDAEGNPVRLVWFTGETEQLAIVATADVRVRHQHAYDFIVTDDASLKLPASYEARADVLEPYRKMHYRGGPLATLARQLARGAKNETLPFLADTARHLSQFRTIVRDDGAPLPPKTTLAERKGACRDLAVLFIELCRYHGLAARFVSGYWRGAGTVAQRYLHAWSEVYLPGAGWVGYDPTTGLAVADEHVPLASARDPLLAAPVEGLFFGSGIDMRMSWNLRIETRAL
ncbi:MAG TPA: transglutaminase family protein [Kiritimatiellia bacterium]|jgi:transglutaminase-like putative cysteine protease